MNLPRTDSEPQTPGGAAGAGLIAVLISRRVIYGGRAAVAYACVQNLRFIMWALQHTTVQLCSTV